MSILKEPLIETGDDENFSNSTAGVSLFSEKLPGAGRNRDAMKPRRQQVKVIMCGTGVGRVAIHGHRTANPVEIVRETISTVAVLFGGALDRTIISQHEYMPDAHMINKKLAM